MIVVLDDMDMSAQRRGVNFSDVNDEQEVKLVNAPHAPSAGLPAGTIDLFKSEVGNGWGLPARGATTWGGLMPAGIKLVDGALAWAAGN